MSNIPTSGFYTPTATNVSNITSSTPHEAQWIRTANTIMVFGTVDATKTGAGAFEIGISLPFPSAFTGGAELNGVWNSNFITSGYVRADAVNDRAACVGNDANTGSSTYYYVFGYRIL